MTIPFFLPSPTYVRTLSLQHPVSLEELCRLANVPCRASGMWINREVEIVSGPRIHVTAEPGSWGRVRIELNTKDRRKQFQLALILMAYTLHDLVAKQSLRGVEWAKLQPPRGRPRSKRPLTNAERQRKFREKSRRG